MSAEELSHTLQRQYAARFSGNEEFRNRVWKVLCDRFFSAYLSPEATVLDLGCGWGEFINSSSAARKFGMDLNPEGAKHLGGDVTFIHADCSDPWPIEPESLDVVFSSNFLEHLPDKGALARTVTEIYRCLRPGGRFVCMCPNIKYLNGTYWDFWDHHLPLTDRSVAELLTLSGFTVTRSVPRFLPFSMSSGARPPLCLVGLYLKLPVLWRFFGKQFLVVAEKGGS